MATSYTSLLGLALPVTGELSGTWGDTVNNYITNYLDAAVAGVQIISGSQTAVTLSVTNGSSLVQVGAGATGSAQYGIIRCSGNPASLLTITAPAASKSYLIINATSTSQSVKIVGTGPTTGVTLVSGESAVVAWNGTDFIKVSSSAVDGVSTFSAGTTGFTPSTATSGAVTLAGTLATTNGGTGLTSFTANGVVYASSSSALTTGSALTFDGTTLANSTGGTPLSLNRTGAGTALIELKQSGVVGSYLGTSGSSDMIFFNGSAAELMRINGTGLGIGTSSPGYKLSVNGASSGAVANIGYNGDTGTGLYVGVNHASNLVQLYASGSANKSMAFYTGATEVMRYDSSGNLGLGVTPSAWFSSYKALQVNTNGSLTSNTDFFAVSNNAFVNTSGNDIYLTTGFAGRYRHVASNGAHQWFTAGSGTAGDPITFTQAMTLDASGNLLVGRTSGTGANIDVYESASNDATIRIGNVQNASVTAIGKQGATTYGATTAGDAFLYADNSLSIMSDNASGVIKFSAGGNAERARITSGGYFKASNDGTYVGSTASYHELRVTGAAGDWNTIFANATATAANAYGIRVSYTGSAPNGTGNAFLNCDDTGATRFVARSNGGLANYSANDVNLSDRREKTNFAPAKSYLDTICAIPVQTFNYIDQSEDDPGLTLGVVAQDVQAVAPELVMESNWGTEDNPKMRLSIYQTDLQYALMKALQELKAEFDAYKATHP